MLFERSEGAGPGTTGIGAPGTVLGGGRPGYRSGRTRPGSERRGEPPRVTGRDRDGAGSLTTRPRSITLREPPRYLIFSIFFEIDIEPKLTLQK